jgi:hypothetical protein
MSDTLLQAFILHRATQVTAFQNAGSYTYHTNIDQLLNILVPQVASMNPLHINSTTCYTYDFAEFPQIESIPFPVLAQYLSRESIPHWLGYFDHLKLHTIPFRARSYC